MSSFYLDLHKILRETMSEKMSNELRQAFAIGRESAVKYRDTKLRVEHVLYGILVTDNIIHEILKQKIKDFDPSPFSVNPVPCHNHPHSIPPPIL